MSTMESYRYSALDESGKKVSGTEKATSVSAAHLMLIQRGLQPIDVKEHKSILKFEITKKTVKRKEIMHFSRQLSVFVEAGIPIMEALEVIAEETTDKLLKKVLLDMVTELQAGDTFAAAAASHPEAFPRYYVAVLESAELTGTLDTVLLELATYLETDIEARSAVTSALIYPAVVAVMAVVTVVVLATFVLPKFRTFFASLNAKLPLPTHAPHRQAAGPQCKRFSCLSRADRKRALSNQHGRPADDPAEQQSALGTGHRVGSRLPERLQLAGLQPSCELFLDADQPSDLGADSQHHSDDRDSPTRESGPDRKPRHLARLRGPACFMDSDRGRIPICRRHGDQLSSGAGSCGKPDRSGSTEYGDGADSLLAPRSGPDQFSRTGERSSVRR